MKKPRSVEDSIRVSWAVNNAVQELSALAQDTGMWGKDTVKEVARKYLEIFEEMIKELPEEVCLVCGGVSDKEGLVNGIHPSCHTDQKMKMNDYLK